MPDEFKNQIVTGDARELAKRIPDESVDLIFTDPVYDRIEDYEWLGNLASRVLKPKGSYLAFCGIGWLQETLDAFSKTPLPHRWINAVFIPGAGSRVARNTFGNWQALIWGGFGPRHHSCDAVISQTATLSGNHRWKKNLSPLIKYIRWFTGNTGTLFDPFSGGGSIPVCSKYLGRNYIAFEIDPDTAEKARERVLNTQPPLFVPEPEQLKLDEPATGPGSGRKA